MLSWLKNGAMVGLVNRAEKQIDQEMGRYLRTKHSSRGLALVVAYASYPTASVGDKGWQDQFLADLKCSYRLKPCPPSEAWQVTAAWLDRGTLTFSNMFDHLYSIGAMNSMLESDKLLSKFFSSPCTDDEKIRELMSRAEQRFLSELPSTIEAQDAANLLAIVVAHYCYPSATIGDNDYRDLFVSALRQSDLLNPQTSTDHFQELCRRWLDLQTISTNELLLLAWRAELSQIVGAIQSLLIQHAKTDNKKVGSTG
jgi:hypothetical protein